MCFYALAGPETHPPADAMATQMVNLNLPVAQTQCTFLGARKDLLQLEATTLFSCL